MESFENITSNIDKIQSVYPSSCLCLLGDFNRAPSDYFCQNHDLLSMVTENTRKDAILDMILLSSKISACFTTEVQPPLANSDHNSVALFNRTDPTKEYKRHCTLLDLRQSNREAFTERLSNIDWSSFYLCNNIESKCTFFQNTLQDLISEIPNFTINFSKRDKQWITPVCKHLINLRWKAFRTKNWCLFNHYKEKLKTEILNAKKLWATKCKRSRSGIWAIVKKQNTDTDLASLKLPNEDDSTLANRINRTLANFLNQNDLRISDVSSKVSFRSNIEINELDTFTELSKMKAHKAPGPDNIPNILLKTNSDLLARPLCHLFNCVIKQSHFPSQWKLSRICPIPKTSPPQIEKLRPISLLNTTSKIFERLFLNQALSYILPQISDNQFGFLPKSSTSSCLVHIHNAIVSFLDCPNISAVTVISFDLRRAFDTLPHYLLLNKLSSFLPYDVFNLIANYLNQRSQEVKVNNSVSDRLSITSGVPQGSILSPILFNVFINDLSFNNDCMLFKYADDTTIVLPHLHSTTSLEASAIINRKVQMMKTWCNNNSIALNTEKTQIMTIKKQRKFRHDIPTQDHIKILGVLFTNNLKWDVQINNLIKKAARQIYVIRILKPVLSQKDLLTFYHGSVLSLLQYASELYIHLPIHLSQRIDKLANRFHYMIHHYKCSCNLFKSPSEIRRQKATKLFLSASHDKQHPLNRLIPDKLPNTGKYRQPLVATDRAAKSFIPYTTKLVNRLI